MEVEEVGVEAEKAIMAMEMEARVTEVWSQARKVRWGRELGEWAHTWKTREFRKRRSKKKKQYKLGKDS